MNENVSYGHDAVGQNSMLSRMAVAYRWLPSSTEPRTVTSAREKVPRGLQVRRGIGRAGDEGGADDPGGKSVGGGEERTQPSSRWYCPGVTCSTGKATR